jgi:hypothetical protein
MMGLVVGLIVVAGMPVLNLLGQQPAKTDEPQSSAAKQAKANYLKEAQKIEDEAADRLAKAKKQYLADLDEARKMALAKDDLNEAQRILAAKNALKDADPLPSSKQLHIVSARYGTEGKWADVTMQVRKMVKNNKLSMAKTKGHIDGFPDPAFGKMKTLVVAYSVGNRHNLVIVGPEDRLDLPPVEPKKKK